MPHACSTTGRPKTSAASAVVESRRARSTARRYVFLWRHDGEKWTRQTTLWGHTMDVLDVAWGADDALLASCSIDNVVMIWDVANPGATAQPRHSLRGHGNWVKGVAWDPTGRFLASASEDRTVLVWRRDPHAAEEFAVAATITKPFEGVSAQTFFHRLSWAPDGRSLGVPNAQKSLQATAAILGRGRWESVADLVGHRHPVTVVRFSPALFRGEDGEAAPRSVVAVGGQDAPGPSGTRTSILAGPLRRSAARSPTRETRERIRSSAPAGDRFCLDVRAAAAAGGLPRLFRGRGLGSRLEQRRRFARGRVARRLDVRVPLRRTTNRAVHWSWPVLQQDDVRRPTPQKTSKTVFFVECSPLQVDADLGERLPAADAAAYLDAAFAVRRPSGVSRLSSESGPPDAAKTIEGGVDIPWRRVVAPPPPRRG